MQCDLHVGVYDICERDPIELQRRSMVKSNPWNLPVSCLGVAVPLVTLGNYVVESVFARWWMSRYLKLRALRVANSAANPVAEAA
jgi:hypothetical protein